MENIENIINQTYLNNDLTYNRKTYEELERHKLLTKIDILNQLINNLHHKEEKIYPSFSYHHHFSNFKTNKRKRQKHQKDLVLNTLEKLNDIKIHEIDSFLPSFNELDNNNNRDIYSGEIKRSIVKGCCYGIDFKIIKDIEIDTDRIMNLNIEVETFTANISEFIKFVEDEKNIPLFFCGIERISKLICKRRRFFEEMKKKYPSHIRFFNEDEESLYFFPIKYNRQFQLVFVWMISLRKDGIPLQKYELLPLMSKKCMY